MWTAAVALRSKTPAFGAGPGNVGVYASELRTFDELGGFGNLEMFWVLHHYSSYVPILSEFGLARIIGFAFSTVDFVRE